MSQTSDTYMCRTIVVVVGSTEATGFRYLHQDVGDGERDGDDDGRGAGGEPPYAHLPSPDGDQDDGGQSARIPDLGIANDCRRR